jgi:predicted transcriptional regulator
MPVQPPDPSVITRVAESYGFGLSEGDVACFAPLVRGVPRSWDAVEELHNRSRSRTTPRWPVCR